MARLMGNRATVRINGSEPIPVYGWSVQEEQPMTEQEWLASTDPARMLEFLQAVKLPPDYRNHATDRKLRLFAVACCRQPGVWDRLVDDVPCPQCDGGGLVKGIKRMGVMAWTKCLDCSGTGRINRSRRAVEVAERYADGLATDAELRTAGLEARAESGWVWCVTRLDMPVCLRQTIYYHSEYPSGVTPTTQASLLRCIAGNPWRPVTLYVSGNGSGEVSTNQSGDGPWWHLNHNDGAVPKIARIAYEQRDWSLLPLIADALEEAGCPGEIECDCLALWCNGKKPNPILAHLRGPGPHARGCHVIDALLGKG